MKLFKPFVIIAIAALVAAPLSPVAAASAVGVNTGTELNQRVATVLSAKLRANGPQDGSVVFGDVSVDVSPELIAAAGDTPEAIATYLLESTSTTNQERAVGLITHRVATAAARASKMVTVDQFAVVPAIGPAWVNQDLKISISGNKVSSAVPVGRSYGTGIGLFVWNHIRTSVKIKRSGGCVATFMKGTFDAIVKGGAVSFAATMLASDAARNGKLVSVTYYDC